MLIGLDPPSKTSAIGRIWKRLTLPASYLGGSTPSRNRGAKEFEVNALKSIVKRPILRLRAQIKLERNHFSVVVFPIHRVAQSETGPQHAAPFLEMRGWGRRRSGDSRTNRFLLPQPDTEPAEDRGEEDRECAGLGDAVATATAATRRRTGRADQEVALEADRIEGDEIEIDADCVGARQRTEGQHVVAEEADGCRERAEVIGEDRRVVVGDGERQAVERRQGAEARAVEKTDCQRGDFARRDQEGVVGGGIVS